MSIRLFNSAGGYIDLESGGNGSTANVFTLPAETGTILTSANTSILTTASTGVVSQAMLATGVGGTGPAFSATGTNQTLSNNTWTVLQYGTEDFDYGSCYDTGTYAFTPNVEGVYQVNAFFQIEALGSGQVYIAIEKNGTRFAECPRGGTNTGAPYPSFQVNSLVYCNGSTDYIKIVALQDSGVSRTVYFERWGRFSASLVRAV